MDTGTLRRRGARASWLVSSASREARRARFMYKEIYVPVDNSDYSNQACVIGVDIARQSGGRVAGCHTYAAKMHDVRFRQMESGLPEEFRDEDEIKRQRKSHDQRI